MESNQNMEQDPLWQAFNEIDEQRRSKRDMILTRQATGIHNIENREDMLAALGRPSSAELTAAEARQIQDANRTQPKGDPTLADVFDPYQTWRDVTAGVGYNERKRFEKHLRQRALFKTPLQHLDDRQGQKLIKAMEREALPPTVIEEARKTLRQMGKYLHEEALRSGPPLFQHLRIKKTRTTEDDFEKYLPVEAHRAIQGCADISDDDRDAIGLAFTVGSRKSTLMHMPWADVDLEKGLIIERYGLDGGATKSGKPHRKPIIPPAREILQRRIDRLHGGVKPEDGLIFPNPKTGKAYARGYTFHFKASLKTAGIDRDDLSFHSTRHGCAVALLSGTMIGQDKPWRMEEVQLYLGHSSIKVTQRYAKLLPGVLAERVTGWTTGDESIHDATNPTISGAGNGIRTHDFNLGKVALYH